MPTTQPARPDVNALAERPETLGTLTRPFLAMTGVGIAAVLGLSALVTGIAGPALSAMSADEVVVRLALSAAATLGALVIGETDAMRATRAARPLGERRHHPATWATLGLAAFTLAGVLRGARRAEGELQRVPQTTAPLGGIEASARARPGDPVAQFALGVAYARAERFADADAPLRRASELAPRSGIVHEWYAWTRLNLHDPRQAVAEYRLALANHDENPSVEDGLVRSLISARRAPEAEEIARRQLARDPRDVRWQELLGWSVLMQNFRTPEAIRILEEARKYDERNAWLEAVLGYAYRSQADFRTATGHFQRAFEIRPLASTAYELGMTHLLACDFAAADSAFATAEKLSGADPLSPQYRRMRAAAVVGDASAATGCTASSAKVPQPR